MPLKTVIHVHTNYSYDADTPPRELARLARARGIDCLAITDHDEVRGALEARDAGIVRVIVGQEISTADGHLLALFAEKPITPGLSAEQTIALIREQGALAFAPHPFMTLADCSLGPVLGQIAAQLDGIEICNAQNPAWWQDRRAARFAQAHKLTPYVGADLHLGWAVGVCYQTLPDFDGPAGFRSALQQAELHAGRFGPRYFATMAWQFGWRRLTGRAWRGFGRNAPAGAGCRNRHAAACSPTAAPVDASV